MPSPTPACFCRRVFLTANSTVVINYQRCADQVWRNNVQINAGGTVQLKYVNGSFSTAFPQSAYSLSTVQIWPIGCGSPTPTPSLSATPSLTPSLTPTLSLTPTVSITSTVTPTMTITPTSSVSITPTITPSPTLSITPTSTISQTPTITPTVSITPSNSTTPGSTTTPTPTVSPSVSTSTSPSITPSNTTTPGGTTTPTPTVTPSITTSSTPTLTPSNSATPGSTTTPTPTVTPSITTSSTPTLTPSNSATPGSTVSVTPTLTPTSSITATVTLTPTSSLTATPSLTPTSSITATPSLTPTVTLTPTSSITATPSLTPTSSLTPTVTLTPTSSLTPTVTPSVTVTPSTVIYQYTVQLDNCCSIGYSLSFIKIQSTNELQDNDRVVVNVGGGNQCWTLSNVVTSSFEVPDFVITEWYSPPADCSTCNDYNPCPTATPSPTPTVTPTSTVTPTVTATPSITPSNVPLLYQITACTDNTVYNASFTLFGYLPTGPYTYISFASGSIPNGCYQIQPQAGELIESYSGVVGDVGTNSTSCIQCTGKPIPSPSPSRTVTPTPSITASKTPTPSVTPSITPTSTPPTIYTLTLLSETGADSCSKGELRIRKNGVVVATWDKNLGSTTVTPDVSSVTFVPGDLMVLEAFSQGGGGAGCVSNTDTLVRGYRGASLVVTALANSGTNPNSYTIPNGNATIGSQFLGVV